MLQNEVKTHDWLVLDDTPSIRQPSIDVSVSLLTPKNELVMQKLIDFVRYSHNAQKNNVETTHILYFCGIYIFRNKFY